MLGAGIFVTMGNFAQTLAGPSVILPCVMAGVPTLAFVSCYTEFAYFMLVAGGAFSYLRTTFGKCFSFFSFSFFLLHQIISQLRMFSLHGNSQCILPTQI